MYVSMFPDWNAGIKFKDSTFAIFDGSKDMFKYYLNIEKYNPSKSKDEVTAIFVKDYYSTTDIDARHAYFVILSDVYGPMGHEPTLLKKKPMQRNF
jgi:copper chaperone NosL